MQLCTPMHISSRSLLRPEECKSGQAIRPHRGVLQKPETLSALDQEMHKAIELRSGQPVASLVSTKTG